MLKLRGLYWPRLAREDAARPFDLARGPLFRAALVRIAPDAHVLLYTVHHIVCDGWSLGFGTPGASLHLTFWSVGWDRMVMP